MWSLGLVAGLIPLPSTASPLPATDVEARNKNGHHYKIDPKCPAGTTPGFQVYTARYHVPAKEFYVKVGSFFDQVWYVSILPAFSYDSFLRTCRIADSVPSHFCRLIVIRLACLPTQPMAQTTRSTQSARSTLPVPCCMSS